MIYCLYLSIFECKCHSKIHIARPNKTCDIYCTYISKHLYNTISSPNYTCYMQFNFSYHCQNEECWHQLEFVFFQWVNLKNCTCISWTNKPRLYLISRNFIKENERMFFCQLMTINLVANDDSKNVITSADIFRCCKEHHEWFIVYIIVCLLETYYVN